MRIIRSTSTALIISTLIGVASAQIQGPSSSQVPYIVPVAPGVKTVSVLTVGDSVSSGGQSYTMVGIPDGMGARSIGGNRIELILNHELSAGNGAVRAHGENGAFVSRWQIRRSDLKVLSGADLIQSVNSTTGNSQLSRLCSGDLPERSAFFPLRQRVRERALRLHQRRRERR